MSEKIVYEYLANQRSNSSFRKWLLNYDNSDNFFNKEDFELLKKLEKDYSDVNSIKQMLNKYVDEKKVNKLTISYSFYKLLKLIDSEDLILVVGKLEKIGNFIPDEKVIETAKKYISLFINVPRVSEKDVWHKKYFIEKRNF